MRIYQRAFELEDYKLINKWRNDDEITFLTGGHKRYVSTEKERKWVEEKIFDENNIYLAICLRENGEMIGYHSLNHIDWRNRQAELGGMIIGRKDLWGKGMAPEASQLMCRFGFEELGLNRIYVYWLEKHVSSSRVLEKLGFKREGLLRQALFKNNSFHDVVLGSILRDEYEEMKKMASEVKAQ
jgi:RimJ/RimL family protein N-acetyltransferase